MKAATGRSALGWGLAAWLVLRLISSAGVWHAQTNLVFGPDVTVPGYTSQPLTGVAGKVAGPWIRGDGYWYLKIVTHGYDKSDGTLAFFPAFPAATWAAHRLVRNEALAALLVANLASLTGLMLLFAFVERAVDQRAARVAVFAVALFPTAFFLVAPYGESMLLFAGAGALLGAQTGRYRLSSAAGALAALSRPFGFLIALPLAAIASADGKSGWRRWLAPAGPIAGAAAWAIYTWRMTGDPLALMRIQDRWQRAPMPVWSTLHAGFTVWRQYAGTDFGHYVLFDLAATLFGIALVPMAFLVLRRHGERGNRLGVGLAAYGLAVLAIPLSLPFAPRPLMSNPRFVLALFPLFLGLALVPGKLRVALACLGSVGLFIGTAVFVAGRPLF